LPGYAWYVPKQKGYLNVGIGGKLSALKKRSRNINAHWLDFAEKLSRSGLGCGRQFSPKGHIYYLRGETKNTRSKNAFLIGDAAGLATCDMGEGIGPAVESAKIAARSIATGQPFCLAPVTRWSLPQILAGPWIAKKNRL
ncbi:MAG: NAD(P)/FAD-dependent oxidoreductase, partial [Desulfobacterales bacterium]|nr:NAD(P)/FAD-dependent oxidoreductase [Desulfobacterales bacterium]